MSEPAARRKTFFQIWPWLLAAIVWCGPAVSSQIADQVIVFPDDSSTSHAVLRFDRELNLIGMTNADPAGNLTMRQGMGVDSTGLYWISFDSINTKQLLRMTSNGQFQPSVLLNNNPVSVTLSSSGTVYALTRIPLTATGPAYAVSSNGTVLWKNPDLASKFTSYAEYPAITPDGRLWVADDTEWVCNCGLFHGLLAQLDTATGSVLQAIPLPDTGTGFGNETFVTYLSTSPDGTLWTGQSHGSIVHVDLVTGTTTPYFINGGFNGGTSQLRVDAHGDVWAVDTYDSLMGHLGDKLLKVSAQDGSVASTVDMGGFIIGFALGAAGEDVFAVVSTPTPPYPRRLVRVNLSTGTRSTRQLLAPTDDCAIPNGDPTGFVYANVIDQRSDNDGDGFTNREETLAGSSPFDASSRPNGPKVYIRFAPVTNAIELTYQDPDGLIDPQGGLDVASLSLKISHYGNVFNYLLPFVTALDVSPDFKQATLTFGALPLPSNKQWTVEARVSDLSGAVGWDWQVTPPGDL